MRASKNARTFRLEQAALSDRRCALAQIPAVDFNIAVFGKWPTTQLALNDHLKPRPLKVESRNTPFGRRTLIEEPLEDTPTNPCCTLIGVEQHGELDAIALVVPPGILGELEELWSLIPLIRQA